MDHCLSRTGSIGRRRPPRSLSRDRHGPAPLGASPSLIRLTDWPPRTAAFGFTRRSFSPAPYCGRPRPVRRLKFHICPETNAGDQSSGAKRSIKLRTPHRKTSANASADAANGVVNCLAKGGGAWSRIRTSDTRIFNPLLYQLSYPGPGPKERRNRSGVRLTAGSRVYRGG